MAEDREALTHEDTESVTSHSGGGKDDLHLSLYPWAHFELAVQPHFSGIEVHSGNKVRCSISDQEVWVTLDSGLSETVLAKSLALSLGLLKGNETTVTAKVTSATGRKKYDVVKLNSIVITFENGQQVNDTVLVMLDTTPLLHDASSLVMGLPVLRRGRMIQTFNEQGSTLFIDSTKRVLEVWRFPKSKGVGTFRVRPEGPRGFLKTVLVSTGMQGFYCSRRFEDKLRRKSRKKRGPYTATLNLGGKHLIKRVKLEVLRDISVDFVMGRNLLHEHEATMDFRRNEILIPRGFLMSKVSLVLRRL